MTGNIPEIKPDTEELHVPRRVHVVEREAPADLSTSTFHKVPVQPSLSKSSETTRAHERPLHLDSQFELSTENTLDPNPTPRTEVTASPTRFGLFKNPAFPYSGGILAKFFSFLANLIKVLEQLVLGLLTGSGANESIFVRPQKARLKETTSQVVVKKKLRSVV